MACLTHVIQPKANPRLVNLRFLVLINRQSCHRPPFPTSLNHPSCCTAGICKSETLHGCCTVSHSDICLSANAKFFQVECTEYRVLSLPFCTLRVCSNDVSSRSPPFHIPFGTLGELSRLERRLRLVLERDCAFQTREEREKIPWSSLEGRPIRLRNSASMGNVVCFLSVALTVGHASTGGLNNQVVVREDTMEFKVSYTIPE